MKHGGLMKNCGCKQGLPTRPDGSGEPSYNQLNHRLEDVMRSFAFGAALLAAAFSQAFPTRAQGNVVFSDQMEADVVARWNGNSCELSQETKITCEGGSSLRLVDRGANAQAYVVLSTEPGQTYDISARAYRLGSNKGDWFGKIAVSIRGGAVSSGNYLASSAFIEQADTWETLRCDFTAPSNRVYLILVGQNATGDVTLFDDVQIRSDGGAMAPIEDSLVVTRKRIETVTLAGTPEQIGTLWGKINCAAIREDMEEYYLAPAKEKNISTDTLIERSERFVELAQEYAPHWLTEARAIARAAEIDDRLYISFAANVYRGLFLGDECTSYAVSPEFTVDNRVFFHKNRDNAPKKQCVFILDSAVEGVNKFIAVSDASVVACMMMVNDKGLAGSADTGGLPVERAECRGWMNTFLLRHIAEKAATCDDALRIIEEFVSKGFYAGGARTGTHWLFVDASGKRLEVSNNSDRVVHEYHTKKVYFSARHDTNAPKILERTQSPIDFATFHNVSRDPSMCFGTTIAGMSVEINRTRPDMLTCAWVSLPAWGLSFPLFVGGTDTPLPLLNGEVFARSNEVNSNRDICERIEAAAFGNQRLLEEKVLALLAAGEDGKATDILNDWTRTCADSHMAVLESCCSQ